MNAELRELLALVRDKRPKTPMTVQTIIEEYFKGLAWSLLKEEYEVHMTLKQQLAFIQKVFHDVGDHHESGRCNQVDKRRRRPT